MKYIKFILLSFLVITLASCTKDDAPSASAPVEGSWKLTQGTIENGTVVANMQGFPVTLSVTGEFVEIGENNRLLLTSDNTYSTIPDTVVVELTFDILGMKQTETVPVDNLFTSGTWERTGEQLTLKESQGMNVPCTIVSLTDLQLELTTNIKNMDLPPDMTDMIESIDLPVRLKFQRM